VCICSEETALSCKCNNCAVHLFAGDVGHRCIVMVKRGQRSRRAPRPLSRHSRIKNHGRARTHSLNACDMRSLCILHFHCTYATEPLAATENNRATLFLGSIKTRKVEIAAATRARLFLPLHCNRFQGGCFFTKCMQRLRALTLKNVINQ
jgi:hypothetical protein